MDKSYEKIHKVLRQRIGLDITTIGNTIIDKAIESRMKSCSAESIEDYYLLIHEKESELTSLLEASVIPETWFFRDDRPYEIIFRKAIKHHSDKKPKPFRILSLPCSSGEEPYSIAMHLLSKGIPQDLFYIDASDVSQLAIDQAINGDYGKKSFRGDIQDTYIKNYFTQSDLHYKINNNIKKQINFHTANILIEDSYKEKYYDIILCRNLLIYFDQETKIRAFENLTKYMKDDGLLFIGHSEFGSIPDNLLINTGYKNAFALRKKAHNEQHQRTFKSINPLNHLNTVRKQISTLKPANITRKNIIKTTKKASNFIKSLAPAGSRNNNENIDDMTIRAKKLADAGDSIQAETLCRDILKIDQTKSDILYLLAMIQFSKGSLTEAESSFRKVLFLNPDHYESLLHMEIILKKSGNDKAANLFHKRAERAHALNNPSEES